MTFPPFQALVYGLLLTGPTARPQAAPAPCPPTALSGSTMAQLKEARFEVAKDDERNRLAIDLLACLDNPDPALRDGFAFEALSTWLRSKALTSATITTLEDRLRAMLTGPRDEGGFRRPFAALALSEVARADRIEPVFTDEVRTALVEVAAASLEQVDDYRGFDPAAGWRHGVAHGSDLILQLALNPKVGAPGIERMMKALARQVAPHGPVFYTFGEPERLARATVYACRRGLLEPAFWEGWIASIASPAPLPDWGSAFTSVDGLAKRHNTVAFLQALSFAGRSGKDEAGRTLGALADRALAQLMAG